MERIPEDSKFEPSSPAPDPPAHGGDLGRAMRLYGGAPEDWLDLSTGVNALPYPLQPPKAGSAIWTRLPDAALTHAAAEAARAAYGVSPDAAVTPTPGAQGAIQALPRLLAQDVFKQDVLGQGVWRQGAAAETDRPLAAIIGPTYAEHAHAFRQAGWRVEEAETLEAAYGAAAAVLVNPNNPDGRVFKSTEISRLRDQVGHLILDESFADETPDRSMVSECGGEGLTVLRSLGKFYGLAGLRLGFAITHPAMAERLTNMLGPWPVSGPALHFGAAALRDRDWARDTRARLAQWGPRLRALGAAAGLAPQGGAGLFQSFKAKDSAAVQSELARRRVWTRIWPDRPGWIRFGAPGPEADWRRLADALHEITL